MATKYQNLSKYDADRLPDVSNRRFAIIVSKWNRDITYNLRDGAYNTLIKHGVKPENITVAYVPGSFELVYGAKRIAENLKPDAVIGLGCVIKGDTPHFEYVCLGVTQGFAQLNAEGKIPYIFGLLTNNTMKQSIDRAGGILGNKGIEAAITAIKMVHFANAFK
jgi:6,7-dimethyl-8-ribityllumazine synthase